MCFPSALLDSHPPPKPPELKGGEIDRKFIKASLPSFWTDHISLKNPGKLGPGLCLCFQKPRFRSQRGGQRSCSILCDPEVKGHSDKIAKFSSITHLPIWKWENGNQNLCEVRESSLEPLGQRQVLGAHCSSMVPFEHRPTWRTFSAVDPSGTLIVVCKQVSYTHKTKQSSSESLLWLEVASWERGGSGGE